MSKQTEDDREVSKAALAVDIHDANLKASQNIEELYMSAQSILNCNHPSKRQCKPLLDAAENLLSLQESYQLTA